MVFVAFCQAADLLEFCFLDFCGGWAVGAKQLVTRFWLTFKFKPNCLAPTIITRFRPYTNENAYPVPTSVEGRPPGLFSV